MREEWDNDNWESVSPNQELQGNSEQQKNPWEAYEEANKNVNKILEDN